MAWKYEFQLKDLLTDYDVEDKIAKEKAAIVVKRLATSPFDPAARQELRILFSAAQNEDDFNVALNRLYDRADAQRIWVK